MKNILLILDCLGSGGAQNQMSMLAVDLKKRNYNVTLITYYAIDFFKKRVVDGDVQLIHIPKNDKLGLNVIKGIKNVIKKNEIDVMISFLNTPNFYAAVARSYSGSKCTLITSHRSKTNFSKLSYFELSRRKWINSTSDFIVANSVHEKERWIEKYPRLKNKMLTIYNGVDGSKFNYSPETKRNNTLLVVGSVGPAKNGLAVIRALKILVDKGIKVNILWIGKRMPNIKFRKDYIEQMDKLIANSNLTEYWTWMNPQQDIERFYQTYKGLILASEVEGLPNVVCEAQCCGMPCIVSDALDHPLLIEHGKNGYLFDPKDPSSLAVAIENFYALSKEEYKSMAENSSVLAREKFSRDKYISSYIDLIEKC